MHENDVTICPIGQKPIYRETDYMYIQGDVVFFLGYNALKSPQAFIPKNPTTGSKTKATLYKLSDFPEAFFDKSGYVTELHKKQLQAIVKYLDARDPNTTDATQLNTLQKQLGTEQKESNYIPPLFIARVTITWPITHQVIVEYLKQYIDAPKEGNYVGQPVIFMMAVAALNGHPEPLAALIEKQPELFTRELLAAAITADGFPTGQSLLFVMAWAATRGHTGPLVALIKQRPNLFTQELLADGFRTGESLLFVMASAATRGHTGPLVALIKQRPNLLTQELLAAAPKSGKDQGKSVLWLMSEAALNGHLGPLVALIAASEKRPDLLTQEMLAAAPEEEAHAGESVLFMMVRAAIKGHPGPLVALIKKRPELFTQELLAALIQKQPDLFTIDILSAAPTQGPDARISVLQKMSPSIINQLIQRKCQGNPDDVSFYNILYNTNKSPSENAKDLLRSYAGAFIAPPNHFSPWAKSYWHALQLYKRIFRNRHHVAMVKELLKHNPTTTKDLVEKCIVGLKSTGTVINPNGELAKRLAFLIRQCNPTDQPSLMGRLEEKYEDKLPLTPQSHSTTRAAFLNDHKVSAPHSTTAQTEGATHPDSNRPRTPKG